MSSPVVVPPINLRMRRESTTSTPARSFSESPRIAAAMSALAARRGNTPAPVSPRVWLKSPGSATVPTFLKLGIVVTPGEVAEGDEASDRNETTSPLVDIRQLSDKSYELSTHPGAGGHPSRVDYYVESDGDVSGSLDAVTYETADAAADGFHAAVLGVSPLHFDAALRVLLDSDDGTPRAVTLTMGYVLDLFQDDNVSIDLTAVAFLTASSKVIDLLLPPPGVGGEEAHVKTIQHRGKWGISGSCRSLAINGIEDIATLPTASEVLARVDPTEAASAVVVFQFRIRRLQSVRFPSVGGDFDVVQHVNFIALPPGPWRRRMGAGFAVSESASPRDASDAIADAIFASVGTPVAAESGGIKRAGTQRYLDSGSIDAGPITPFTDTTTGAPSRDIDSDSSPSPPGPDGQEQSPNGAYDADDSQRMMVQHALRSLIREVIAGPNKAIAVMPVTMHQLVASVEIGEALNDFERLRTATSRVTQPATAFEIEAVRQAESQRLEAMAAIKAMVRLLREPAVLVNRHTWNIEAASPAAERIMPPDAAVLELCHFSGRRDVLSAAEVVDLMEARTRSGALIHEPIHMAAGSGRMLDSCDQLGADLLLLRFAPASPSPTEAEPSTTEGSMEFPKGNVMRGVTNGNLAQQAAGPLPAVPIAERVERQHEAKKRFVEEKRAAAGRSNRESTCSCVVA
jgi:hypothetical protein